MGLLRIQSQVNREDGLKCLRNREARSSPYSQRPTSSQRGRTSHSSRKKRSKSRNWCWKKCRSARWRTLQSSRTNSWRLPRSRAECETRMRRVKPPQSCKWQWTHLHCAPVYRVAERRSTSKRTTSTCTYQMNLLAAIASKLSLKWHKRYQVSIKTSG